MVIGLAVIVMLIAILLYTGYVRLERRRKENSIRRHRKISLEDGQCRIFTLIPPQSTSNAKKVNDRPVRFPKEFRYFQVITNNCKMEFCSLEEIQEILNTQIFTEFKHPVVKDNVMISDLFLVVNGVIMPRNFVTGCFVAKSHDRINLVTFWGDVLKIKTSELFGEEAVCNLEKLIEGMCQHAGTFSYSGYLVKSMLNRAIDDYRSGSVNYKALITGE